MKLTAISLFLLLLPLASALSFEFDSPAAVEVHTNFSVSISAASSENYDVKVFVLNNETNVIISEVYNEGWKNPYYYLKSAFPSQSSFLVRATNSSEKAAICVRLRKTGGSSYTEECKTLALSGPRASEQVEEDSTPAVASINETTAPATAEKSEDFIPLKREAPLQEPNQAQPDDSGDIIHLNTRDANNTFITKAEKTRLYAAYSFTAFVILLVIFLIFKKL